jgi:glycosyltransferase involved in cell wall biosynthesis
MAETLIDVDGGSVVLRSAPSRRLGRPAERAVWCVGGDDLALRLPFLCALRSAGLNVEAVGTGASDPFAQAGIRFHWYPLNRELAPWADLRSLTRLRALAAAFRPAIIHGFDTKPSLMAPLASGLCGGIQAVRTINGLGRTFAPMSRGGRLLQLGYCAAQRLVAPSTATVIFQNHHDRDFFRARRLVSDERAVVIPGAGVDTDAFSPAAVDPLTRERLRRELGIERQLVVTCVARMTRQKGIATLCAAAGLLARERSDIVTLLVGPHASEGGDAVPQREIDRHAPHVRALGERPDIARILALSDVFVLPTAYGEGVPRALLEAAALELPLIATRVPGCTDVIEDGRNGLLFEPGDAQALATAIARLAASAPMRRRMGQRARRRVVERFSLTRVTAAHVGIYQNLLER